MRLSVESILPPDETIQAVFQGYRISPYLGPIWALSVYLGGVRIVALTDKQIAVFSAQRFRFNRARRQLGSLSRSSQLGPPEGLLWYKCTKLAEPTYVARRDFDSIRLGDSLAPS